MKKKTPRAQVTLSDFRAAQTRVRPSGMREVALELPKVTWADVGGHSAIKQRLKEAVEWPQKHPEMLARMGAKVSPRQGRHDPFAQNMHLWWGARWGAFLRAWPLNTGRDLSWLRGFRV